MIGNGRRRGYWLVTPSSVARFLLATCFLVLLFNGGARFAIGLLLQPMTEDLGWSRSEVSLNVTLFMVLTAGAMFLVGRLVDRVGAATVLGAAVLVSAVGLTSMGFIEHPWQALLLYGVVFALGSAGTSITPIGVLLSRWYPHRMGMANSIAISGMGLGQLLVISLLAAQLAVLGWRGSFFALGLATLVCILPLLLFARSAPGPAPAPPPADASRTAASPEGGAATLREALASRRLQLLLVIYAICGFQDFLIAVHVVAFAVDEGVDVLLAGNILAFMGLAGVGGVLLTGVLNDRRGPVLPTAICFLLRTLLCAALLVSREPAVIAGAALLFGVTFWVIAPLTVVFGREIAAWSRLGAVTGFITMVHHSAGGFGALVGGSVFDAYGSYDRAFVLMLVLSVIALGLTLALPRPRVPRPPVGVA